jgi:anti-sigma-K factor RskA
LIHGDANSGEHEQFRRLAAAATCGALTAEESESLERHLRGCEECRGVFREYQVLANEGFALLASNYEHREEMGAWNEAAARRRLLADVEKIGWSPSMSLDSPTGRLVVRRIVLAGALAACLLAGVGIGAWQLGNRQRIGATSAEGSLDGRMTELLSDKKSVETALAVEVGNLTRLQQDYAAKRRALEELQGRFQDLQNRLQAERAVALAGVVEMSQARTAAETQLSLVTQQRDQLSEQLRNARQAYDHAEVELASLRAERDKARLQLASLETRISELTADNQRQERRVKDSEQYLASDRDIRDLMSARNLYIADVFDVDSRSRTRKPFGRVFFTRGKSLLFYAFDLDQQPQLKNANTFQVWGQKETDQREAARAVDLGLLYLDSEANRRWFLRFDNPQTLSEIDAVFVTVEPHGGSLKPTGKPFLFATLRREANHP